MRNDFVADDGGFTNLQVLKRGCATFSANSEIAFEMMKNQFFAEIVE